MIVYEEPDELGKTVRKEFTEAQAIEQSKLYAARLGHTYPNDEEALIDFIVIHWAWRE